MNGMYGWSPAGGGLPGVLAALFVALGIAGCNGTDRSSSEAEPPPPPATTSAGILVVQVRNDLDVGIAGASVVVESGGATHQKTTPAGGDVEFSGLSPGHTKVTVAADGFEATTLDQVLLVGRQVWGVNLRANGAWAIGRTFVTATRAVARSSDGSRLTIAVDVAVVGGEDSEPLETLTPGDFRLVIYDCGWFGPRVCASDSSGDWTSTYGEFTTDGLPRDFALQPAAAGHPYLVGVLWDRSVYGTDWNAVGPALKSFVTTLGADHVLGLASVQLENGATTFTELSPFGSDSALHLDAIDGFSQPSGDRPPPQPGLLDAIRWTAAARDSRVPAMTATLLVLSSMYLTRDEVAEAAALARDLDVRVSSLSSGDWGSSEVAVRSGGFVAGVDDARQYGMVMGAMDRVLAQTLPFYRMEFLLGGPIDTFVPGGNVKLLMHVDVPARIPSRGIFVEFDVAIPPE